VHHYRTQVLSGFTMRAERPSGDKVTRAYPAASRAEAGDIEIVGGAWSSALLDELELFPQGRHDDQVDALSAAIAMHTTRRHLVPVAVGEANRGLVRESPWRI
jgi:predicted phage terminase large subunit-like protein